MSTDIVLAVSIASLFLFLILIRLRRRFQSGPIRSVSPVEALAMIGENTPVIDVRTLSEFKSATGHLPTARLIPVHELGSRLSELSHLKDKPILVYCRSGHRSVVASKLLARQGFNPLNLTGGIIRWIGESMPIER